MAKEHETLPVREDLLAGSYLFMDADYSANEADERAPQFEHALFVKSQVMSRQRAADDDRAVVDAGHKRHAIDSGLPKVWAGHDADWLFFNGGDEHGILRGTHLPELGDNRLAHPQPLRSHGEFARPNDRRAGRVSAWMCGAHHPRGYAGLRALKSTARLARHVASFADKALTFSAEQPIT